MTPLVTRLASLCATAAFGVAGLSLAGCTDTASAPTTPAPSVTVAEPAPSHSVRDIEARIRSVAGAELTDDELAYLADTANRAALRDLSNDLWNGTAAPRNRAASTRLADAYFRYTPDAWARLRLGIGHLNGVGVEQNTARAVELLSADALNEDPAAVYFLSRAHAAQGDVDLQLAALERAAELGHPKATSDLGMLRRE